MKICHAQAIGVRNPGFLQRRFRQSSMLGWFQSEVIVLSTPVEREMLVRDLDLVAPRLQSTVDDTNQSETVAADSLFDRREPDRLLRQLQ